MFKASIRNFSLLFLSVLLICSCNYTNYKSSSSSFRNTPRLSKEVTDGLSYQLIAQQVLNPYCLSCHRESSSSISKSKVYLDSYSRVIDHLADIRSSVFEKGTMPKRKELPVRERSLLLAWIEAGAPEFGKTTQEPLPPPPPLEPTYSSIRDRIFNVRCADCHNPSSKGCQAIKGNNKSGSLSVNSTERVNTAETHSTDKNTEGISAESCQIELGNYNELLNGDEERRRDIILKDDPTAGTLAEESQLLISIQRRDGKDQMPPPEFGFEPLSPEEIKVIKEWVIQGAQNN